MASDIKNNILEASSRLFYEQGYNKTSLRQIAKACGIEIGNLYYYYKKKIDLVLELRINKISRDVEQIITFCGDMIYSYTGLIAIDYMLYSLLAVDHKACRVYVEASGEQEFKDLCANLHQKLLIKLVGKEGLRIKPMEAFWANNYCCAGEIQMVNFYYNHETSVNLDKLVIQCLIMRLLMLGLSEDEARLHAKEGIALARSVIEEFGVKAYEWREVENSAFSLYDK